MALLKCLNPKTDEPIANGSIDTSDIIAGTCFIASPSSVGGTFIAPPSLEANGNGFSFVSPFTKTELSDIISNRDDIDISSQNYVPAWKVSSDNTSARLGWIFVDIDDDTIGVSALGQSETKNGTPYVTICDSDDKSIDALIYLLTSMKEERAQLKRMRDDDSD